MLIKNFVISAFSKGYDDYVYVCDLKNCIFCAKNYDGILFNSYDAALKAKNKLQKEYPRCEFEVESIFIEE